MKNYLGLVNMKILSLAFEFPSRKQDAIVSGEIKNAYNFIMELSRKGHSVTVFNITMGDYPDLYYIDNVKVYTIRDVSFRGVIRYLYRTLMVRAFINKCNDEFDFIHSHVSYGSVGVTLSKLREKTLFTTPHGTNIPEIKTELTRSLKDRLRRINAEMQRWLDVYAFKHSKKIISVSQFQLEEMSNIYNVDNSKTLVVYNGVNQDLYYRKNISSPKGNKKVLFVGRACKKKGLDVVYLLANKYPHIEFTIITGTRMFNTIGYDLLDKLAVLPNCNCLEAVSEEILGDYYRDADLTVVPSRGYESLPTVILESISCGTPAISVNAWGNPEVIIDNNLLFKEDDFDDICRALDYVLDNDINIEEAYRVKYLNVEVDLLLSYIGK
jgi:glycosyltransferase involved in cell wall biosynthesis